MHKHLEIIKKNESKPKFLKNIFNKQEIERFTKLYNELPITVHNKKQNVIKKRWLIDYGKDLERLFYDKLKNEIGDFEYDNLKSDDGKNIFATKNRYGNDFLKYAISGFQETFYDSFPIFIPNVNGFRRIQTRNFVPVNKSWSWNRRDVSLRIPAGSDSSKRIEHRVASADANPYLVLACILSGLHYGLTKKQMPTNQISFDNNEGADKEADPEMPKTLTQALERFKNSKILRNYFGQEYIDLYIAVKQGELEHMEQSFIPREEYSFYL